MEKIINRAKYNNPILKAIRGTLEHRATWLYLLLKEAEKKGIRWEDIGYQAIGNCGCIQGEELSDMGKNSSLKVLKKRLFTKAAQIVFEMKIIKSTDKILEIDFGYCPLICAWQKLGCTDKDIKRLCDISMEGDRGIAKAFGGRLDLGETIANGAKRCQVRFIKD